MRHINGNISFASLKTHLNTTKLVSWKYTWSLDHPNMSFEGLQTLQKYTKHLSKPEVSQQLQSTTILPNDPFHNASAPSMTEIYNKSLMSNSLSGAYSNASYCICSNHRHYEVGFNEDSPPSYSFASAPSYNAMIIDDISNQGIELEASFGTPPSYSMVMRDSNDDKEKLNPPPKHPFQSKLQDSSSLKTHLNKTPNSTLDWINSTE